MSCIDLSMDQMEQSRIVNKYVILIDKLAKRTHFNKLEVQNLVLLYEKMKKQEHESGSKVKGVTKQFFMTFLHESLRLTDSTLHEKIISALEFKGTPNSLMITLDTWICGLSVMLRGTLDEKISHCFYVYSPTHDGLIGRDTIFNLIKGCLYSSGSDDDAEEAVKDLIDVLMRKFDLDRDGKISFQDYKESVLINPLLLESFGPCLPQRRAAHTFEYTIFKNKYRL